jgi:murein DD-endopeptidase MepM/ murein hydrolase activator NlpD
MRNNYYIFVVAHSIRGRIRRVHIPQYAVYICCVFALIGFATVLAAVGSYGRMLLKTAEFNHLRSEANSLKDKYNKLRTTMSETELQLASLQVLASEVSAAYGIVRPSAGLWDGGQGGSGLQESTEQFQLLLRAAYTSPTMRQQFLIQRRGRVMIPMDWPVEGAITGSFGDRLDPFNGEGTFHAGIDISCPYATPVRAAADGVVTSTVRESGYGLTVVIDHGRGLSTVYAHLSGFYVAAGQWVLGGEIIGLSGRSGRSTGPHLHYEVRNGDAPDNPLRYLRRRFASVARASGDD